MMFVFIGSWWRSLWLVVLVFEECLKLRRGVLLFIVGARYCAIVTASCTGFRRMSQTLRGCVALHCRLLVIVRLLHLVVLVFEYCLVVHAYCTAGGCDFLAVNWVVGVI